MNVIVRRRCAFGIFEKYSASPSIAATPDPLSTDASQKPSVCAMTRMFSSVMPGRTPNTADGFRFGRDSIASRIRTFTGWPASSSSRAAVPSSRPTENHGTFVRFGPSPPLPQSCVVKLPGMPSTMTMAAAPFLFGQQHRAVRLRRVVQRARRRHAVDEHRLAAHVASGEVGRRAEADPDGVEVETGRRRADRAQHRMRGLERQRLRAARDVHRPRRGEPGRRERGLLEPDVHAEAAQLRGDQLLRFRVRRRAGDPAPPLIARVAALARDRRQLLDVRLEMSAVDPAVGGRGRRGAATADSSLRAGRSARRRSGSAPRAAPAAPRGPAPSTATTASTLSTLRPLRTRIISPRRARSRCDRVLRSSPPASCPTGGSLRGTSRLRASAARRSRRGPRCSAPSGRRSSRAC